jgi:hypothetical protein
MTELRQEMAKDIAERFIMVRDNAVELNHEMVGKALEELKEYVVNKYGFSRLVFELSKRSRSLSKDPNGMMNSEEADQLFKDFDEWIKSIQ